MTRWAMLTGEYPPQAGGVADYAALVAEGLAEAGDRVTVFAPPCDRADHPSAVRTVRLADRFGAAGQRQAEAEMAAKRPDRVLVQYVPHAYGRKAMNVPFVRWVAGLARRVAPVWVMFHEVAFPLRWWPPQHALLGLVTRRMAATLAGCAARVFVSIPGWVPLLKNLCPRMTEPEWLPIPATVGDLAPPELVRQVRDRLAPRGRLVGHFGTYGPLIADLLSPLLIELLDRDPTLSVLLMGRESSQYRDRFPALNSRLVATGELPPVELSAHLKACDLLVQPFPDGVSSRRTSAMAGLANGVPVLTNLGFLSEPLWADGGVAVAPSPEPRESARRAAELLADEPARRALGLQGRKLYDRTFSLARTIAALRGQR